jgi:hypothetical protein
VSGVAPSAPELSSGRFQNWACCLAMCATVRSTPSSSSVGHSSAPGTQRSSRSTPSVLSPVAWGQGQGGVIGLGLGLAGSGAGAGVGAGVAALTSSLTEPRCTGTRTGTREAMFS